MRYGIMSDIHGNTAALAAVSADVPPGTMILHIGDLVGYGPHPDEVVQVMRDIPGVRGNHDDAALGLENLSRYNESAKTSARWTAEQLSEDSRAVLAALPYVLRIEDPDGVDATFTLVHGSAEEPERFHYVETNQAAMRCIQASTTEVTFVGHTHLASSYSRPHGTGRVLYEKHGITVPGGPPDLKVLDPGQSHVVAIGSVGQPRDGRATSCYVVFDAHARTVEWRRVAYDVSATVEDIRRTGLPSRNWERLRSGL